MNTSLSQYLSQKQITGTLFEDLLEVGDREQEVLGCLVETLLPSANTLREILRMSREIALRDGQAIADVLMRPELREAVEQEGKSRKQKQHQLLVELKRLRYPEISKVLLELEKGLRELIKETGLRLELPKDLEGDTLTMTVHAKSPEDCLDLSRKLEILGEHPETRRIFSLLRGSEEV